ncbi:MAG: hypothetical protein M3T49_03805, partial [Candidatus Eremiobacteraeota bacterium]|nr:hypothetical protein [Candidatus Eremiobacteraeota bacterium]
MIRGLGAALALAFTLNAAPVCAAVLGQAALPPGETTLPSGLTLALRRIATAPVGAIAVWIKSPADGYDGRRPGLARVSAYALAAQKLGGGSLRDRVRAEGGSINISVFPMATELAVVVPSYAAPSVADALLRRALHPVIDAGAFREAKTAAAADMTIAGTIPDIAFRDALFAQAFPAGPLHESTYGDPRALGAITLSDVRRFSARAYAPPNEMVAAVGAIDPAGVLDRLSALAEPAQGGTPIPASGHAPRAAAGVAQRAPDLPGIG